jgi:peptide/nickel transport system ATP-binding protein
VVSHVSDVVGVMYLGRLVEVVEAQQLFARPLHPYTRMLVDTIPDLAMSGLEREPPLGEIGDSLAPPPGCAFHPRCRFANERCRAEVPVLRPVPGGEVACHAVQEGRLRPHEAMHQQPAVSWLNVAPMASAEAN